jgi:hypothetical protein
MNTTPRAWIAKVIQTNKNAIDGSGLRLRIGSSNTAYSSYDMFTATTYPTLGGFFVEAIQPSISQWITSNTGSPNHAADTTWVVESDAAFTAKAPNLGMDAIDVIDVGTGLTLTRGDSTDTDGTFDDFVTEDEGEANNRWGIVQTRNDIIYVTGVLSIGNTTVNTEFTDSNRVLVFPDYRVGNGFCGVDIDASNSGSNTQISACIFNGKGDLYTNDDTRPDYTVTGTFGNVSITSCTFDGFREISTQSSTNMTFCSLLNGLSVIQNSANLWNTTVISPTNLINTGFITTDNPTKLNNLTIEMGTGGGHAMEITDTGTYTLTGHSYTGYASTNNQSNSVIYNNSGNTVTLNIVGGDVPSIRNGTGASTTVTASVNVTLTGMKDNTEVRVFLQGTTTVVDGIENATAGTSDDRSFTFSTSASTALDIRLINKTYEYLLIQYTTSGDANQSIPVQQSFDRTYDNPA